MLPTTSMQRCGDRGRVYGHSEDGADGRGRGLCLGIPSESRMREIRLSGCASR
jgi:hypothetical protein